MFWTHNESHVTFEYNNGSEVVRKSRGAAQRVFVNLSWLTRHQSRTFLMVGRQNC